MSKPEAVAQREKSPSWIREARSFQGLAEAMRDPQVKVAFLRFPAPYEDETAALTKKTFGKNDLPLSLTGIHRDEDDALVEKICAYYQEHIVSAFPEYQLFNSKLRTEFFPDEEALIGRQYDGQEAWHRDGSPMRIYNPGWLRIICVQNGEPTEFALNERGDEAFTPPAGAVTIHRTLVHDAELQAWHRKPRPKILEPRCIAIFELRAT